MHTIESFIVLTTVLIIIFLSFSLILNEFNFVVEYCQEISTRLKNFKVFNTGDVLRITKVISDTGGEIIDEVIQKYKN